MGRYVIKVPDIGEGMTEAEIVAWHVAPGQAIREEDPLVDVMTDKATVELPAPVAGTIVAIHGRPGEKRPVGSELVELDVLGEGNVTAAESPHPPLAQASGPPSPAMQERDGSAAASRAETPTLPANDGRVTPVSLSRIAGEGARAQGARAGEGRQRMSLRPAGLARGEPGEGAGPMTMPGRPGTKPLASPAVRRRAWDAGIELPFVPGTGPGGRITAQDFDTYLASRSGAALSGTVTRGPARRDEVEEVPIIGLRRAIAEHLQKSKRHIPHFSYVEEVDVTALEELRAQLNETYPDREHLTLLPFLIRALANAVAAHPQVNARYDDEAGVLHRHTAVHIGVATQTDAGLLVPVIHHAEALDLWQSASELRRLAAAARDGNASREELTGSTITITSLGALGGLAATPVINYPEVAIVGVNRIAERPVVLAGLHGGQIAIRRMMNLSSSFDHRIVDGWEAASFIQRVKRQLEHPAMLFIG